MGQKRLALLLMQSSMGLGHWIYDARRMLWPRRSLSTNRRAWGQHFDSISLLGFMLWNHNHGGMRNDTCGKIERNADAF